MFTTSIKSYIREVMQPFRKLLAIAIDAAAVSLVDLAVSLGRVADRLSPPCDGVIVNAGRRYVMIPGRTGIIDIDGPGRRSGEEEGTDIVGGGGAEGRDPRLRLAGDQGKPPARGEGPERVR